MKIIKVGLKKRSYNIYVGYNISSRIDKLIPRSLLKSPNLLITNKKIYSLSGRNILKRFKKASVMIVPDSERAKSLKVYNQIIESLSKIGKKTRPVIIALGGGVIGDVAGFSASTYRRGIPYIQVPSTLLAQVDSSIGGKVAIDTPEAKNLIGSFYQPKCVISDTKLLNTLPKKEIVNGMAEVIKYGIIKDKAFFLYIEKNLKNILALERNSIEHVVSRCASIKARVVEKDEFDSKNIRAILNLGHTIGHAIEASFSYSKKYTHGEAVAIGIVLAARISLKLGMISERDAERIKNLIKRAGLPVKAGGADVKKIMLAMAYDKKFTRGRNRFVLPRGIGSVRIVEGISDTLIRKVLREAL